MKKTLRLKCLKWNKVKTGPNGKSETPLIKKSPRPEGEQEVCRRKRRYPDEPMARAFAAGRARNTDQKMMFVYRCKVCSGWHLTNRPNGTPATEQDTFARGAKLA